MRRIINEKLSPLVFLVYSMETIIAIYFIISLISIPVIIKSIYNGKYSIFESIITQILILLFLIMVIGLSVLGAGFFQQKAYKIEKGKIRIFPVRFGLSTGYTIFTDDIIKCERVYAIPYSHSYKKILKKGYINRFSSIYQHDICLIKLKNDFKIISKGKIQYGPHTPEKIFGKKFNFPRGFIIPTHVINSYIDKGYSFPCKIKSQK